jgi:hypothetical protein
MSVELYRQFLAALEKTPLDGQFVAYEWGNLPTSLDFTWLPFCEMFKEFAREIANSLNDLTNYTHRLKAWSLVIPSMGNEEKLNAAQEFIDPLATVSLNLPYVIRSRFIFAAAHLCHQANQSRAGMPWQDDLPLDHEIFFKEADNYGAGWRQYRPFKDCLERLGDRKYQTETHDFRNAYNHRFSPRVVIGITQAVIRKVDPQTKGISYVLGCTPALTRRSKRFRD